MTTHLYPKLYEVTKSGKIKQWQIKVIDQDLYANIEVEHGFIDGTLTQSFYSVYKGKNIGKANETTYLQQAESEAQSKWQKKLDKGYSTDPSGINPNIKLPMLALDYHKRKHNIEVPFFVQPKLNGIRCLATKVRDGVIEYKSRLGKTFTTLEHLTPTLNNLLIVDQTFDGELYVHETPLQEIVSIVRCESEDRGRSNIEYWVYDIAISDMNFFGRDVLMRSINKFNPPNSKVKFVETISLNNLDKIKPQHDFYVNNNFEGLMIRNYIGTYEFNNRSSNLQKYKIHNSDEYLIIGGQEGIGKDEGCIIFICETEEGKLFSVRPKGSIADRKAIFKNLDKYIGKLLTVNYFGLTNEGIPIHPVGVTIRDYE
jgi:DNA ligase 1